MRPVRMVYGQPHLPRTLPLAATEHRGALIRAAGRALGAHVPRHWAAPSEPTSPSPSRSGRGRVPRTRLTGMWRASPSRRLACRYLQPLPLPQGLKRSGRRRSCCMASSSCSTSGGGPGSVHATGTPSQSPTDTQAGALACVEAAGRLLVVRPVGQLLSSLPHRVPLLPLQSSTRRLRLDVSDRDGDVPI